MKQIGITGTMGSGKSFICSIFKEQFGIPVFDSDEEAKACYAEPEVRRAVRQAALRVWMSSSFNHLFYKLDIFLFYIYRIR